MNASARRSESESDECLSPRSPRPGGKKKPIRRSYTHYLASDLTGHRASLAEMFQDPNFNAGMGLVIGANICLIIHETDFQSACVGSDDLSECQSKVIDVLNTIFLLIYTIEAVVRLYTFRVRTFRSMFNNLDLFIVVAGFVDMVLSAHTQGRPGPSMSLFRLVRVVRLLRVVRVFQKIPELHSMMRGFLSSMKSMFWGFVLICGFLLFFSVLSVELIHPFSINIHRDDDYCKSSFSSVWDCLLLFFQILVAGDEFGRCLMPIIKEQAWTFSIFVTALICVQLGFMNLVLAVIVERAALAKEEDDHELRREKQIASQKATSKLSRICADIDKDGSGTLSLAELLAGFDANDEMKNMFGKLDINRRDVEVLFELMDIDKLGELSYEYLISNLRDTQLGDSRKTLTMLQLQAAQIARYCSRLTSELCMRSRPMSRQVSPATASRPLSKNAFMFDTPQSHPQTGATDHWPAAASSDRQEGRSDALQGRTSFGSEMSTFFESLDGELAEIRNSMVRLINSALPEPHPLADLSRVSPEIGAVCERELTGIKPFAPEDDVRPSCSGVLFEEQRADNQSAPLNKLLYSGQGQDLVSQNLKIPAKVEDVTSHADQVQFVGRIYM